MNTDKLRDELRNCGDDYRYLKSIVPDVQNLHAWLAYRAATVDLIAGAAPTQVETQGDKP